ncbi:hypothetical protein B0H17DRAFT_1192234 [Mycena rosella]|uniref:F-box domain-containing protein n=1 Tax=Mycena rosella TaxID=1033263 RepID=A0AAD7GY26_MYCRO|nr:hypothetical protein B0H17DRAFT_1192234 [Mycena rosella]
MAFLAVSPTTRVLEIPELLHMIFGFLGDPSNAANACVCKRWNSIALDTLWSEVEDLHRLFGLLGPLKQLGDSPDAPYAFIANPDADDWRRFTKYSARVRRLFFHAESGLLRLSPTVFEDVARTRTSLNILPNVNTLSWAGPLSLAVMFMHANVKRFVLWLPDKFAVPDLPLQPQYDLLPFFRDVASRMPNLTYLDLRTNMPMHDMEVDLIFLLRSLAKLRKVVFPRFECTTRIAETLAQLPDLGTLEFQYVPEQGLGDPSDTHVFRPTLAMGAFPSLWDLSLTISLNDGVQFMRNSFAPTNLTALYFDSYLVESPAVVHELLSLLAETCHLLESLGIVTLIGPNSPNEERINFSTLRPLLNFPNLLIFEIIHQNPLDLTLEDLDQLARSWPSLKKLILNNEPAVSEHSTLTLQALLPFARHCPEIEQLGLFINASTADLPSSPTNFTSSYQSLPFGKLKRLSMGVSLLEDAGAVALFLSQLCPLGTHIEYGVTWETDALIESLLDAMVNRCEKWRKVEELLPLLTRLRMQERERTRLLGVEVQDLRMRSGVLMDTVDRRGGDSCVVV